MALIDKGSVLQQFMGFTRLPVFRQLGLMLGLAASVSLGIMIVSWSQEPDYTPLFVGLGTADASRVVQILDQSKVRYRINGGTVTVPVAQVHELRLKLASEGLPRGDVQGYELLDGEQKFGASSFMETSRYNRALEGELSKSVATLDGVQNARVHLAIPKQSVFVRKGNKPSASILVNLYPGKELSDSQVSGVVHLVASSVPDMDTEDVTLIDQKGRLLTTATANSPLGMSSEQLRFSRTVEQDYINRIMNILAPIVGADRVNAEVTADIDFTATERTSESYAPDKITMRSEQTLEEGNSGGRASGVPGALTNQPPAAGTLSEQEDGNEESSAANLFTSKSATRNYEVDRTISHVRETPGSIRRLSVAVVLDYRDEIDDEGNVTRVPLPADELERLNSLVKDAVGFNATRNDSVNLVNVSFREPDLLEPLPDSPFWEKPWLVPFGKQLLGWGAVLLLILGVLRPVLASLAKEGAAPRRLEHGEALEGQIQLSADQVNLSGAGMAALPGSVGYAQQLAMAQSLVNQDPKRVAQVMKGWVGADE